MIRRGLVYGVVIVGGLYFALMGGWFSTLDWWTVRRQLREERAAIERLRHEIDSLRAWSELVREDSATIERVARETYGMMRDGEILYRVEPERDDSNQER